MSYSDREKSINAAAVVKTMPCPKCDGEMFFTGVCYTTNPPYYAHECDKCGYKESFLNVIYPGIEYEEIK